MTKKERNKTKQNIKSNKLKKYRLLIAERNENKRKTNKKKIHVTSIVSCVCCEYIYRVYVV